MAKRVLISVLGILALFAGCEKRNDPVDLCPDDPYKTHPGVCGCGVDDIIDVEKKQVICPVLVDLCPNDPNKTEPGICGCGYPDDDLDRNGLADCVDEKIDLCPDDPNKKFPGACGCNVKDIISEDGKTVICEEDKIDLCPDDPNKTKPGICGCGESDESDPETGIPKCIFDKINLCPNDPNKKLPGVCGCGKPDVDINNNGIIDCREVLVDLCPYDPEKTHPGECGCGIKELIDVDGNNLCASDNFDLCPDDPFKRNPGICGCGYADTDSDKDGVPNCIDDKFEDKDYCTSEDKVLPGVCGCDVSDLILDPETGVPKCVSEFIDLCPDDPEKTRPGVCGCGLDDATDTDSDGTPDCIDKCPDDPGKIAEGICGCGIEDSNENLADSDGDMVPNCLDACPETPWKSVDDGCDCNAIQYELNDSGSFLCAHVISDANAFVDFRDKWNDGTISITSGSSVFLIVNDINLGDVMTLEDAEKWIGIGTKEHPFDGILTGYDIKTKNASTRTISATRTSGQAMFKLTLGNEDSDNNALFGYTHAARMSALDIRLSLVGNDHVAGLVANAVETSISGIRYLEGNVSGKTFVAGLVAEAQGCSMKNVGIDRMKEGGNKEALVRIHSEDAYVGGIVASARNTQVSNAAVNGSIVGTKYVGGIAGQASTSTVSSSYTHGDVLGAEIVGGIVGELTSRSSVLNAYSASNVVCQESICASLVGAISEFSTVKNAYSTGNVIDSRQSELTDVVPKSDPLVSGGDVPEPENPDAPEDLETVEVSTPMAALIASFKSSDNVVDKLYYWDMFSSPAIPEEAVAMKFVTAPDPFSYIALVPYVGNVKLIDVLQGNLTCFGDSSCSLDGTACQGWTNEKWMTSRPDMSNMTFNIPSF